MSFSISILSGPRTTDYFTTTLTGVDTFFSKHISLHKNEANVKDVQFVIIFFLTNTIQEKYCNKRIMLLQLIVYATVVIIAQKQNIPHNKRNVHSRQSHTVKRDTFVCVVNSFKGSHGLARCLASLTQCKQHGRILVISGGEDEVACENHHTHWLLKVKHNSIDFTGLISLIEHYDFLKKHLGYFKTVYYTHDTTEYGPNSWTLIQEKASDDHSMPLIRGAPNMNMGIYQMADLFMVSQSLMEKRSSDNPNIGERRTLKRKAVDHEGFLFKKFNEVTHKNWLSTIQDELCAKRV